MEEFVSTVFHKPAFTKDQNSLISMFNDLFEIFFYT